MPARSARSEAHALNIVLYNHTFLPQVGGREFVMYHLADGLRRLGHRVRVVGPAGWLRHRHVAFPFPVHRWPGLGGRRGERLLRTQLRADVRFWGADVIHAHSTYPSGAVAVDVARQAGIPAIVTPHGEDIHVIPEIGHGLRLDPRLAPRIEATVRAADAVTAISASVERALQEAGASPRQIRPIPNGTDSERFARVEPGTVRARHGIPEDAALILTVGSYVRRRGHEELVEAVSRLRARQPRAHLVIAGRGTGVLEPHIYRLGAEGFVTLTGSIDHPVLSGTARDDLAALYRSAQVYVSAGMAEGAEGLSLALLDAMAAGKPIVATDISGNRDVLRPDTSALLVPPGDAQALCTALERVLGDATLAASLGARARQDVEPYDWTAIASEYVDCYQEAIARLRGSRQAVAAG